MKKVLLVLPVLLALSCAREMDEQYHVVTGGGVEESEKIDASDIDPLIVPGVAKILFSDEIVAEIEAYGGDGIPVTKSSPLGSMLSEMGVASMERLFPYAGEYEARTREDGLHKWYIVTFDKDIPVTKAGNDLASFKEVEVFEPVRKIVPLSVSRNDTYWNQLWGINGTYSVDCLPVWEDYTVGDPNVIVAVVDGGIQLDHPDLAWNCLESGHYNYVTSSTDIVPDNDGHGCHVAGIIAAVANNGKGSAGVAGGDYAAGQRGAGLLSLAVFSGNRQAYSFEAAIKAGADKGALISQNSWGYPLDANDDGTVTSAERQSYINRHNSPDRSFTDAVDYFIRRAGCDAQGNQKPNSPMKGGIVLFAAGNDDMQYGPPSNYEPIVAVGAIAKSGARASFSNYGDWVDICAPGTEIMSTIHNSRYAAYGGTSMACPHVSGVAALIISHFGGQGFTCDDLKDALLGGAREIGASTGTKPVGPLVDAHGSFMYMIAGVPDPVTEYTPVASGNSISINLKSNGSFGYLAAASKSRSALESMDPRSPGSNIITARLEMGDDKTIGEDISVVLKKLDFSTDYYVTVYSYGTSYADPAPIKQVRTGENHAPVINLNPAIGTFKQYMNVSLPLDIYDPDFNDIDVSLTTNGRAKIEKDRNGVWYFLLNCQLSPSGEFTGTISARDEYGKQTDRTFTYWVTENNPPEEVLPLENVWLTEAGDEATIDLAEHFVDPDEEQLSFTSAVIDKSILRGSLEGSVLTVKALDEGLGTVAVSASDAMGEKLVREFKVLVRPLSEKVTLDPGTEVTDYLNILASVSPEETEVTLVSYYGVKVFSKKGKYSAFEPVEIDTSKLARGLYYLTVSYGGNTCKYNIVKK